MPVKSKKQRKTKIKKEKSKSTQSLALKKKPEVKAEKKEIKEEVKEQEKSLEQDVSDEQIEKENFARFSMPAASATPVLEKIAEAPETPGIDWKLSESRQEKKQEKKDYALLEEGVTEKYTVAEIGNAEAPVLIRTERMDISSLQQEPFHMGRRFAFSPVQELISEKEDYEAIRPSGDFEPGKKEKEEIGRKYKPKHN